MYGKKWSEKKGPYTDDKYQYQFNFINKVPPGVTLVSKNVLTGEVKNVEVGDRGISNVLGLKAVMATWLPWVQTKYVSSLFKTINYEEFEYVTKDRVTLMVDLACEVKIVDGAKYEFTSSSVNEQLKTTIAKAVRSAVISHTVDEILHSNFNLFSLIRPALNQFRDKYGVEISDVQLQNIKLPNGVRKSYEDNLTTKVDVNRIRAIGEANAYAKQEDTKVDILRRKAEVNEEIRRKNAEVDANIKKKQGESEIKMNQLMKTLDIMRDLSFEQLELFKAMGIAVFSDSVNFVYVDPTSSNIKSTSKILEKDKMGK